MNITTKFEIGDRVVDGAVVGSVDDIDINIRNGQPIVAYHIKGEGTNEGIYFWRSEVKLTMAPNKLTPEETWVQCALKIGFLVSDYGTPIYASESSEIRRQCYIILGGNGVDVGRQGTDKHEEIKAKLNVLIETASHF